MTNLLEKAIQGQESEKIFSLAFKLNPNTLILSLKSDGTIIEVNEGFSSLFGYTREEAIGQTSTSLNLFVHPEDRNKLMEILKRKKDIKSHEIYVKKKTGEICPVLLSAEILFVGNTEALLTTLQDISGLKQTQEALKKTKEAYQQLFDSANSIILRWDITGRISLVNEFGLKFFGYTQDELSGQNVRKLMPEIESSGRNLQFLIDDIVNNPFKYEKLENENLKKNGDRVWISWTNRAIYDENGKVTEILAIGNDITNLKKAENELKVEHDILNAVVGNIGVGFIVCDNDGTITSMNEAACKLYDIPGTYQGLTYKMLRQLIRMKLPDGTLIPYSEWPIAKSLEGQYVKDLKMIVTRCNSETNRIINYNSTPVYNIQGGLSSIVLTLTDLTDIEERTRLLNQERELFRGIVDHIPVMISTYDPQLSHFNFNEEFKNTLGWTEEDADDGKFMEKAYPDPDYRNAVAEFMQSLEFGWKEWKVTAKNGSIIDSMWANVFLSSGMQIGIGIDIRERKKAEEKQKENEQRLQGIFDNAALGIVETDGKDRFVRVNNRICQILDYAPHELIGKTVTDITYPPDRHVSTLRNTRLQKGEVNMFTYEKRYMKKNGEPLWVRVSVSSILDYNGKYLKSIGTVEDISETRKAIEALTESEEKFRSIFENITEGVALYELLLENNDVINHSVISVNPAFEKFTKLNAHNIAMGEGLDEEKAHMKDYYEVALTGNPFRYESYFSKIDKHLIINVISPRYGQFATVFEDITELKKIENQIKQKNDELTQFVYTVSHDLRSPLVTIKSFSEFLLEDSEKSDKFSMQQDIRYIQNAAEKMGRLLDELLEISRIGRKDEPKTEIPLNQVIQSALDLVAGMINRNNVQVITKNIDIMVYGSFQRLVQVYQNLIDNATKFMGNQPEPFIEIGTKVSKSSGELLLYVRDNGQGIDKRHQHKIFGMFEKVDTGSEGTGIGLAIVKRIIELHDGKIGVESEGPGKGTEFYFTLNSKIK